MLGRISLDPNAPDNLYSGALKINSALEVMETELSKKLESLPQDNGSVVIPIGGGFKCRYNQVDSCVDIEFAGSGIPYEKTDTSFTGTLTDVEIV